MPNFDNYTNIRGHMKILRANVSLAGTFILLFLPQIVSAGGGLSLLRLDIGMSSVYDNNILRYSDKYIARFDNREDEGRFHINTRDDLILVSSVRASATMKLFGSLNTTGTVDVRRRTYTHNTIKDWSSFGMSLRQDLIRQLAVQIGYNYIPSFYIRHYRDDDWISQYGYTPITFQPYGFRKDEVSGSVQYAVFASTRVRALFSYMRYFYNEHFTEYDCRNTAFGGEVYQTIHKTLKIKGVYEYTTSRGDGTPDMNPSYDEDNYVLGAEYQLPRVFGRTNAIEVEGEYARRCYTTHHFLAIDVNHAGRRDYDYRFSATYGLELLDNLDLALKYAWHRRDVKTSAAENAEYLSDEKDYRQYELGLEARYVLNFLTSQDSESERSK